MWNVNPNRQWNDVRLRPYLRRENRTRSYQLVGRCWHQRQQRVDGGSMVELAACCTDSLTAPPARLHRAGSFALRAWRGCTAPYAGAARRYAASRTGQSRSCSSRSRSAPASGLALCVRAWPFKALNRHRHLHRWPNAARASKIPPPTSSATNHRPPARSKPRRLRSQARVDRGQPGWGRFAPQKRT